MNETTKLTPDEVNQLATTHFGTGTLKWIEESANSFARAVEDKLNEKNTQVTVEAYSEIVAARFEAMRERGDAWVTTTAAAAIARNPHSRPVGGRKECEHSWTEESRSNGWRSSCRLCGQEAAGSGQ